MYLSKSKYCNAIQCKKMLWLDKNFPEERVDVVNQQILDNGTEVGELARGLFGVYHNIEFNKDLNKMISDTEEALKEESIVITEASFNYNDNFCSVDILKKDGNNYELYEVKSSSEVKDIYLHDISYQYYVLKKLGLNVRKACIVHINNKYVRGSDLELDKLFEIVDVTDIALNNLNEVDKNIKEINDYMEQKEVPNDDIGMHCVTPYDCPFFKYCTKNIGSPNVFDVRGLSYKSKFKYYYEGIYSYQELLKKDINWKCREQVEFELYNKEPKINKIAIREFFKTLKDPLYFLDFETYQNPIPEYYGLRPNEQIPFQYSLHYIDKGNLFHKEFLSEVGVDPRRSLADALVRDIPLDVCVVAYNMKFEKMIIKNLSLVYPDLKEHLMNIYNNMRDLMVPFINRDYYAKDMNGSYSIKYVLPALFPDDPSLNYHNLDDVHNGTEAMSAYRNMDKLDKEEQIKLRNNLLKYCELDTYAMVKIYKKLKKVVDDK